MPRQTLRPNTLDTLKPGPNGERVYYRDTEAKGLALRVGRENEKETRVFYFLYNLNNKTKRLRLGDIDERHDDGKPVTLSDRRKEADGLRGQVSKGVDPMAERKAVRAEVKGHETFAALGERALLAMERTLRKKTTTELRRLWTKNLLPAMGHVDAQDARAVVEAAYVMSDALVARKRLYGANRSLELARRIMSFAVAMDRGAGVYLANPLLRLQKPLKEEAIRTRVYSPDEVRRIVTGSVGTLYEDVIPLLLATGARAGETLAADWSEFDSAEKTWTIPAAKAKIKHPRPVHLNRFALSALGRLAGSEKDWPTSGWLFPARSVSGHRERMQKEIYRIREWTPKPEPGAKAEVKGVPDFELHDLRRVVRSGLSDLGVSTDVAELCLGHLPPKLVRRYSPHPSFWRMNDQRGVIEAWGSRLERILSDSEGAGADVLPMRR